MVRQAVTLALLRDMVRLGGPESDMVARRMALRATRDIANEKTAERLREALAGHLCDMVSDFNIGEAVGEDLSAVSVSGARALAVIDQIEAILKAQP